MEDLKNLICKEVEDKKQEVINNYDLKIQEIKDESDVAKIYYLLTLTFHNDMQQGELGIELLKSNFTNDFFINAQTKNEVNYISFLNDNYKIMFSKSLIKQIIIKAKRLKKPNYYPIVSDYNQKLFQLMNIYFNNKTFKNFKMLINHLDKKYLTKNKFIKYLKTYKYCNKQLLEELQEKIEYDKILHEQYEKELSEFNKNQEEINEFIKQLTDLNIFIKEKWDVKLVFKD